MLHSAHPHWTKGGNLIRSTGEIDLQPVCSSAIQQWISPSGYVPGPWLESLPRAQKSLYPQSKASVLIGSCDWLVR